MRRLGLKVDVSARAMNWEYVLFHLVVQFLLLWAVFVGVFVLQTFVLDPVVALVYRTWPAVNWDAASIAPLLRTLQHTQLFSMWSFVLWMTVAFGSSFILHLPSMWMKRVQIYRPVRPLDPEWYSKLKKPIWHPPNFCFPLLWVPVRVLRSIGSSLLWEALRRNPLSPPLMLPIFAMVWSDIWNQVFFVQHDMVGGIGVMSSLTFAEICYAFLIAHYVPGASFYIYFGVFADMFATCINISITLWNRKEVKKPSSKNAKSVNGASATSNTSGTESDVDATRTTASIKVD
ncbi:hypothetical protein FVE85_7464 [Porphyridium purpureum]|uniref:Uncharacterized protein n=1 Tax=Porphyridium purpureum TaxID=35688 RepID=A0A5J4Z779_PORPP|nr:hypothetical protein FVE85_7464 [Porphyridium purpureum]|eukprot:POR7537..scf295_1